MKSRAALLGMLMLTALLVVACAPRETAPKSDAEPTATLIAMPTEAKRSEIGTGFPVEIPVVAGLVVRGQPQGESAWDYEIVVDASPRQVADWYEDAYLGREWERVERGQTSSAEEATVLSFAKGRGQSRIDISAVGGDTRVIGVVGVGTPVLQVQ